MSLVDQQQEALTVANARIVQGIIFARQSADDKAISAFEAAEEKMPMLARMNLQVLKPTSDKRYISAKSRPTGTVVERIGGLDVEDIKAKVLNSPTIVRKLKAATDEDSLLSIYVKESNDWIGCLFNVDDKFQYLLATSSSYSGTSSRGVKIGSPIDDLVIRYGSAQKVIPFRKGNTYVYSTEKMVFFVSEDQKVSQWMLYSR